MMKKLSAMVIASTIAMAATPAFADQENHDVGGQTKSQALGYIGKLSKSAIQSGQFHRLKAGANYGDVYYGVGDESLSARIIFWHKVALDSVALDHTPTEEGVFPALSQGGPTRTSRALAMVQVAVFDALNAIDGTYNSYAAKRLKAPRFASADAAVTYAAYSTLMRLYPAQEERLNAILDEEVTRIQSFTPRVSFKLGKRVGIESYKAMRDIRQNDKSNRTEPDFGEGGAVADGNTTHFGTPVNGGTSLIGEWQSDPNTAEEAFEFNLALGAYWGEVTPFFLDSGDQFRIPPPPTTDSAEYAAAYAEVAALGGSPDNLNTVSTSSDDTRFIGNYWGYDGVPLIGVPPRIYNQITAQLANAEYADQPIELARVLAMVNIGLADAGISAWDSKFFYNMWRPVVGIRAEDDNPATEQDVTWDPVGISVLNTTSPLRPTPPFPSYPSGHATFGGVTFEILRDIFGDDHSFTFVSDEYNGEGFDPFFPDAPRPFVPVRFDTLTEAQEQNGISRIYNGVHWIFDNIEGQNQGVQIGRYLLDEVDAFKPKKKRGKKW